MKENKCMVSVITVCLNSGAAIEKTIMSVLEQTYQNWQYIIVDGGSMDCTIDIIKKYKKILGDKMQIISEPDNGIYDAMNKGIAMAGGDIIGIINSGDYYEKDALQSIVSNMTDDKYQVIYGMLRKWKDGKEHTVSLLSHNFLTEHMIWHPACFVSRSVYDDMGKFNLKYFSAADYDFMIRVAKNEKVHFIPVYSIIANFAGDGMSDSVEGYLDGLRLRKDYGMISGFTYYFYRVLEPFRRWMMKVLWG